VVEKSITRTLMPVALKMASAALDHSGDEKALLAMNWVSARTRPRPLS
jgi:hypothetical protein